MWRLLLLQQVLLENGLLEDQKLCKNPCNPIELKDSQDPN